MDEIGSRTCSRYSAGLVVSSGSLRTRVSRPRTTPAIVAWTPLSWVNHQAATASGM